MATRAKQEVLGPATEQERAMLEVFPPMAREQDESDPADVALANVIAELGGQGVDAKVNIYQLDAATKNNAFVGSFLPSEFSLESVQSQFGPGEYLVHVRKEGKIAARQTLRIAAPKNTPAPASSALESNKIIEAMTGGFQQMGAMFAQALAGLAQNQPKPKSTKETLEEFALMKQVFGHDAPQAPQNDPMQLIQLAMDLSSKMNPRESEPSAGEIILKAVESFAPTINTVMSQSGQKSPAALPLSHAPQVPQIPQEVDEMKLMHQVYIRTLMAAARTGADPATYANNVLDLVPESEVLAFVSPPNWFDAVAAHLPEAVEFKNWFEELKKEILVLTADDEAGSVEASNTPATS